MRLCRCLCFAVPYKLRCAWRERRRPDRTALAFQFVSSFPVLRQHLMHTRSRATHTVARCCHLSDIAHASSLRLRSAGAHFVRRPVGLASALTCFGMVYFRPAVINSKTRPDGPRAGQARPRGAQPKAACVSDINSAQPAKKPPLALLQCSAFRIRQSKLPGNNTLSGTWFNNQALHTSSSVWAVSSCMSAYSTMFKGRLP